MRTTKFISVFKRMVYFSNCCISKAFLIVMSFDSKSKSASQIVDFRKGDMIGEPFIQEFSRKRNYCI